MGGAIAPSPGYATGGQCYEVKRIKTSLFSHIRRIVEQGLGHHEVLSISSIKPILSRRLFLQTKHDNEISKNSMISAVSLRIGVTRSFDWEGGE